MKDFYYSLYLVDNSKSEDNQIHLTSFIEKYRASNAMDKLKRQHPENKYIISKIYI